MAYHRATPLPARYDVRQGTALVKTSHRASNHAAVTPGDSWTLREEKRTYDSRLCGAFPVSSTTMDAVRQKMDPCWVTTHDTVHTVASEEHPLYSYTIEESANSWGLITPKTTERPMRSCC